MASRNRLFTLTVLLLTLALFIVSCTRILSRDGGDVTPPAGDTVVQNTPENTVAPAETETPVATPAETSDAAAEGEETETPEVAATATDEGTSPRATEETEEEEPPVDETPDSEASATKPAIEIEPTAEVQVEETAEPEPTEAAAAETEVAEETAPEETAAATPTSHVVQPGENLYRIGLQYGVSWVTLAQANGITNPNRITVGQELQIPGAQPPTSTPTPSPTTELIYTVRPGDNLFKIGLTYGVTWDQIAEANGLVNPNQIYVGQELKIPASAPGPSPQFTHIVQQGDTLFKISIRYGVTWQAIAEANNLTSPYIIYTGQTLLIPGD